MAISVGPDQTAPIGAVCSGPTLFASLLKFTSYGWTIICSRRFQQTTFSDACFGALRVNAYGLANSEYLDEMLHHVAYHQ